jgi:hypothetical protein
MKLSPYALACAMAWSCGLVLPSSSTAEAPRTLDRARASHDYYAAVESTSASDETAASAPVVTNNSACGCGETDCDCDHTYSDCAYGCDPTWSFRVGSIIMRRSDPSGFPIFTDGAGPTLVDAGDYDFKYRAGVDFGVTRHLNDEWAVDFRYFGIDSWTAGQSNALTPVVTLNNAAPVAFFNFTTANSTYSSNLHSTEFNLRRDGEWLTTFAGYRYVELSEDLGFLLGANPTIYRESVDNRMHGFQIGAEADLWNNGSNFRLESWTKAGIYYDFVRHGSQIELPPGNPLFSPVNQRDNNTAFLGEIGLVGVYQLTDSIALRGGYQLMWLDGVALASDQVPASNFANGTGNDVHGDVFFHGFLAGVEARW